MDSDLVRDLNNYLQGHPAGNLSRYLSWAMQEGGLDHQKTHYATAKFNGRDIGFGKGLSKGLAKREAAEKGLKYLKSIPIESLFS